MFAPAGGFAAAGVNHVTASRDNCSENFLTGACPVVAGYGRPRTRNEVTGRRADNFVVTAGVDHDIKTYRDAGHVSGSPATPAG
jgi:carboxymethylenebutenolidase